MREDITCLLTGTIVVSQHMKQVSLVDAAERKKQYLDCIRWLIEQRFFKRIIFCENSGYAGEDFESVRKLAEKHGISFEYLSFTADEKETIKHGKGYGEAKIIEYVMDHSQLIHCGEYFFKLTGRLKICNLGRILRKQQLKKENIYINRFFRHKTHYADTRAFFMPVAVYESFFRMCYLKCDDASGMYLERVFFDTIKQQGLPAKNTVSAFDYIGMSGSSGAVYKMSRIKFTVYDLLHKINYFSI